MTSIPSSRRTARAALLLALFLLVALFAALLLLTPFELRSDWLRNRIEPRVSAAAGGRFTYRTLQVSIFPRPGITLTNVALDREELAAAAAAATLFPKLWPLLRGAFQPAAVRLKTPELRISAAVVSRDAPSLAAPMEVLRWAELAAAEGLSRLPRVDIEVTGGRLRVAGPRGFNLDVQGIRADLRLADDPPSAELSCESNLWKRFTLKGALSTDPLKGQIEMGLSDFHPAPLLALAFPQSRFELAEGRVNLSVRASAEGAGSAQARLEGDTAHLRIRHAADETDVDIDAFVAELDLRPGRLAVSVPQLAARKPSCEASLNLVYDEALAPRLAIDLEGRGVDVDGVRRAALALLSDSEDVRALFDVLRGGSVPRIEVRLQGNALEDLGHLDHLELNGRLEQGRLFIPGVKLDLEEVFGDAAIVDGILEGRRLSAHYRGTQGENGSLRLGLDAATPLLALDIAMRADLAPLPEVLSRVVKNRAFLRELGRVEQFLGSARGRLELTGTRADVQVRVEAAELDIRARHHSLPLPLAFTGGRVHYDESSLALEEVDVRLGDSRLQRLRAILELQAPHRLHASAPAAEIDLAEAFQLLSAAGAVSRLQSLKGTVRLQPWEVSTTLAAPESVEFDGAGQVRDLLLTSELLPDMVSVASAAWTGRGKRIQAETRAMSMGPTRVEALSGVFDWSDVPRIELSRGALFLAVDHLNWFLAPQVGLHTRIGPLEPLSGVLVFNGLQGGVSLRSTVAAEPDFSATLAHGLIQSARLPSGLSLDSGRITWRGSTLDIQHLNARMEESAARDVSVVIDWGPRDSVRVQAESLLLECGEIYPWLSRLPAAEGLRRDVAELLGTIAASGLRLSGGLREPHRWRLQSLATFNHMEITTTFLEKPVYLRDGRVEIGHDPVSADSGSAIRLDAFQAATGGNRAMASGDIRWKADAVSLDLALTAESVVWSEVQALAERFARRDPVTRRSVTGRVEVRADDLLLGHHRFQPVEAHVRFGPAGTTVEIERAGLCGVETIGRLDLSGGELDAFLVPIADNTLLDGTLSCLTGEKAIATGQFNIDGTIHSRSAPSDFLKAMSGKIEFISEDGRILRSDLLARVLSLINVTEIYRGTVPDLTGRGLEYKRTRISGEFSNGELLIHSWTLDGPSLWLGARGKIHLIDETLQLFIVVSPFKTFDRIIRSVPLLGYLLGGRLVAVPVQVSGSLADPAVVPMHPAALGESLLEMVGRALLLPVQIVQPLIPGLEESVEVKGSILRRD